MPYTVIIIRATGAIEHTTQAKAPEWKQLKEAVSGYIETVPYLSSITIPLNGAPVTFSRGRAFINENGFAEGLLFNEKATTLWRKWPQSLRAYGGKGSLMNLYGDMVFYAKQPKATKTLGSADKSPKEERKFRD